MRLTYYIHLRYIGNACNSLLMAMPSKHTYTYGPFMHDCTYARIVVGGVTHAYYIAPAPSARYVCGHTILAHILQLRLQSNEHRCGV